MPSNILSASENPKKITTSKLSFTFGNILLPCYDWLFMCATGFLRVLWSLVYSGYRKYSESFRFCPLFYNAAICQDQKEIILFPIYLHLAPLLWHSLRAFSNWWRLPPKTHSRLHLLWSTITAELCTLDGALTWPALALPEQEAVFTMATGQAGAATEKNT